MPTLTGRIPAVGRISGPLSPSGALPSTAPPSGMVLWLRADSGVTLNDATITFPNDFSNAAWSRTGISNVVTDATVDPVGATLADSVVENGANSVHLLAQAVGSVVTGIAGTWSVYAKANTRTWLYMDDTNSSCYFDLSTGTVGTAVGCVGSAVPAGNGWYRCSIAVTSIFSATMRVGLATGDGVNSYVGDGASALYLYGAAVSQRKVSAWADQSGLGHDLTQVTAANQPLLVDAAENGSLAVRFDTSGGDSLASAAFTLNQPEDVFAVMKVLTQGTAGVLDIGWDGIAAGDMVLGNIIAGTVAISAGVALSYAGVDLAFPAYDYFECQYNGATSVVNAHGLALGSTGNAGANNAGGFTLGGLANGTRGMNAEYTEILIYNRILSAAERTQLNNYLKWRYDIPDPMPFIPPLLPGCVLWLRADLGVTLNAGNVSAWADQSGLGNNFVQGTAASQALLLPSSLSGQTSVDFDGLDDWYDGPGGNLVYTSPSQYTTFEVFNVDIISTNVPPPADYANDSVMGQGGSALVGTPMRSAGPLYVAYTWDGADKSVNLAISLLTSTFAMTRLGAGILSGRINNGPESTVACGNINGGAGAGATHLELGRGIVAQYYDGRVAEFIAYNRALTVAEQGQVAAYLRSRYNI
jgi:hypothetical protein